MSFKKLGLLALLSLTALPAAAQTQTIRVGVTPGPHAQILEAAKPIEVTPSAVPIPVQGKPASAREPARADHAHKAEAKATPAPAAAREPAPAPAPAPSAAKSESLLDKRF